MGRPLVRECALRTRVDVYLDAAERVEVHRRAAEAHMPVSAFIRKSALGQRVTTVPVGNAERWSSLGRLTANLNQIAHHLNSGQHYEIDTVLIERLTAEVRGLRLGLIGAEQ